ncbi:MAG: hypothetical protein LBC10_01240, partial [Deltaproteobacteria bacterium]|nr:hypothetical protein [Deltaproteobacteria bacterium]
MNDFVILVNGIERHYWRPACADPFFGISRLFFRLFRMCHFGVVGGQQPVQTLCSGQDYGEC